MAERFYRAQILLEPEQHKAIAEIARSQGKSISEVVRQMIALQLQQQEQDTQTERLKALECIRQHRAEILARRGGQPLDLDTVQIINEMREERDERNLGGVSVHRD